MEWWMKYVLMFKTKINNGKTMKCESVWQKSLQSPKARLMGERLILIREGGNLP